MKEYLSNSQIISAIIISIPTIVLVIITAIYTCLTHKILKEMRKQNISNRIDILILSSTISEQTMIAAGVKNSEIFKKKEGKFYKVIKSLQKEINDTTPLSIIFNQPEKSENDEG